MNNPPQQGEKCQCVNMFNNTVTDVAFCPIHKLKTASDEMAKKADKRWEIFENLADDLWYNSGNHVILKEMLRTYLNQIAKEAKTKTLHDIWILIAGTSGAKQYRSVEIIDAIKNYAYEDGIDITHE